MQLNYPRNISVLARPICSSLVAYLIRPKNPKHDSSEVLVLKHLAFPVTLVGVADLGHFDKRSVISP
jgi:hypothetical protein